MAQLSATMQEAIKYAKQHGNKIVRHRGGYWAHAAWAGPAEHSFGTTTIDALVTRGLAQYTSWKENQTGRFPVEITLLQSCSKCDGRGWYLEQFSDSHRTQCSNCGGAGRL